MGISLEEESKGRTVFLFTTRMCILNKNKNWNNHKCSLILDIDWAFISWSQLLLFCQFYQLVRLKLYLIWNLVLLSCTIKRKYLKKGVLQFLCLKWVIKSVVLPTLSRCQFNDIHFISGQKNRQIVCLMRHSTTLCKLWNMWVSLKL